MNGLAPGYLEDISRRNIEKSIYNLEISRRNPALPVVKTDYYRNCFAYTGAKVWNALPDEMGYENSKGAIKHEIRISQYLYRLSAQNFTCKIVFWFCL